MKVVLSGFYGFGNTGDDAILEAIIDNLKTRWPSIDITVLSFSPEDTANTHDVKSIYRGWRQGNADKIKAIKNADVLISGGGGLLQDTYSTGIISGPLPYYLMVVLLAKCLGTKVMFFSQGVGPITTSYGKFLTRMIANKVDLITVRDSASLTTLNNLGVKKPEKIVTADIVFAFQEKPMGDLVKETIERIKKEETPVAVSVRPWFESDAYIQKQFATILDELIRQRGITPIFTPMESSHDYNASMNVMKLMDHGDCCILLEPKYKANDYLHILKHCRLTLGMRLHSLIFSTLASTPLIGFSYDPKVESFLKLVDMWNMSTSINTIDTSKIVDNALDILNNRSPYINTINKARESLKQKAEKNLDLLETYFLKRSHSYEDPNYIHI